MRRVHRMPFGAELRPAGATRFRLWAPSQQRVLLELAGAPAMPMARDADGWHELIAPATAGARYAYRLPSGVLIPDPASRCNPDDVHGPSEVIDPEGYDWQDDGWCGRPWQEAVLYELHVGTFTPEGTYDGARARLGHLAALGVTAVELMPLAEFPGRRNWGYDGVLPFAPEASYGRPEQLKALVDAAHALGLMVLLDVVYNHFGPEGNYLHGHVPEFFNAAHQTPWGAAINYDGADCAAVRQFFIHNALYWVEEFHLDGLRLDAVHAIRDDSPTHIVCELARALRAGPGRERHVHVVLENDANQTRFLERDASGAPNCASAQWNDDVHHAMHVLVTRERDGYYADYADAPLERLGRALAEGFAYQGEPSAFRGGAPRGEPSEHLPSEAFISFLQTHDQAGNRALGERLHVLADPVLERAAYACVLLAPHVPMLFMGEEWGARTPFLYFCDFGPELAAAVSRGRRQEFGAFAAFGSDLPEPNERSSFEASRLDWAELAQPAHRERLEYVRRLLALRAKHIVPLGKGIRSGHAAVEGGVLHVQWTTARGERLYLVANFGAGASEAQNVPQGEALFVEGAVAAGGGSWRLDRGGVRWSLDKARADR